MKGQINNLVVQGRDEIRQRYAEDAEIALEESQSAASIEESRRMGRITQRGAWL